MTPEEVLVEEFAVAVAVELVVDYADCLRLLHP
jgi:hypothetical protein